MDGGSRAKAKGPARRWKLSAAEHLVERLSQALGVSAGEGKCPWWDAASRRGRGSSEAAERERGVRERLCSSGSNILCFRLFL